MNEFTSIRGATLTLKELLRQHITLSLEPQLKDVPIDIRSPKEMKENNVSLGISVWLYRVTRNEHMVNDPPTRVSRNQLSRHPLPVNLHYLVTPLSDDPEAEQALLGRILQVFNDHVILRGSDLKNSLAGSEQELRITLEALSLEELSRIWNALEASYQLSVTYMVQVIVIESHKEPVQVSPVEVKETEYTQIISVT